MTAEQIYERLKATAKRTVPSDGTALLFGSQARGTANEYSDWDILILLNKDKITYQDYADIAYPFDKLGWDLDAMISPIIYTKQDWENARFTPFYKNVMKEGIIL